MKKIIFICCIVLSMIFISCEDDRVEKNIDKVTDKIEKSMDKAEDKIEKAGEKAAGDKIEEIIE